MGKRILKEKYAKDILKKGGIYKITNLVNGKMYIGSTAVLGERYEQHADKLNGKTHANKHLQSSFNKYGKDNFKWEIIVVIERPDSIADDEFGDLITDCEQHYIDYYEVVEKGYNQRKIATSNLGFKHSEESKKNMKMGRKDSIKCI